MLETGGLERTIERLVGDGLVTAGEALALREELPRLLAQSGYVLRHLGAHAAIGGIFLFDPTPLPLGTACRVLWVAGSRLWETLFGSPERASVHSLPVFLIAAIPALGYAAYLLPLRRQSETAAFLFANHVSYALFDAPTEALVVRSPRLLRRVARKLLPTRPPPAAARRAYTRPAGASPERRHELTARFEILDPLLEPAAAEAMLRLCESFGRYGCYAEDATNAVPFAPGLPQRFDAAWNFVQTGGRFGRKEEPALLAARTNYFRETYAYDDDAIPGIGPFKDHPALLEAARKVHDCAVVAPNIVYANLLLPGQELAVHTDVPEFRGANRKLYPQWLMVVMLHSGLFAPWRRKIATGIAYFGTARGGELAFYPDGREGAVRTLDGAPQHGHRARHRHRLPRRRSRRRDAAAAGVAPGHAPHLGGRRLARGPRGGAARALPARRGALLGLVEGLLLSRRSRAAHRGRAPRRPLARADPRHAEGGPARAGGWRSRATRSGSRGS